MKSRYFRSTLGAAFAAASLAAFAAPAMANPDDHVFSTEGYDGRTSDSVVIYSSPVIVPEVIYTPSVMAPYEPDGVIVYETAPPIVWLDSVQLSDQLIDPLG